MKTTGRSSLAALAVAGLAKGATTVPGTTSNADVSNAFVSFSIEFSSFPDFAGDNAKPNKFSDNLLTNIGNIVGTKPYIRVGGNTQDFALYDSSQSKALVGVTPKGSDYPTTVTIGDKYFESYNTWSNTKYCHGFNMALGGSTAKGFQTLVDTVPLACKALSGSKFYAFEYGNEPNLYAPKVRPSSWDVDTYVSQWKNGTDEIVALVKKHCSGMAATFMGPSFSGPDDGFAASDAFSDGFDGNGDVKYFSSHNYIAGAQDPGVTLQGTLMNHANTVKSVAAHVTDYTAVQGADSSAPPMILGEANSLYDEGKPGLSNTFGAALWGVDFNLYSASVGIQRVHMHQGTDYRYASWQPIDTSNTTIGTKAPYYGNIAVAAMLGDLTKEPAAIANIALSSDQEAAYAAYTNSGNKLARILVLNMNAYNSTVDGAGVSPISPSKLGKRPSTKYSFTVDGLQKGTKVSVQRLSAGGSDAISGITWDGYSYNYELNMGKPVMMKNVTIGETTTAGDGGVLTVSVPDSSAVILNLAAKSSGKGASTGEGLAKASNPKTSGAERRMNVLGWRM